MQSSNRALGSAADDRAARNRGPLGAAAARGAVIVSVVGIVAGCSGGGTTAAPTDASVPASATPAATSSEHTPSHKAEAPAATPVLGSASTGTKGYGTARPPQIDGGRDSSGIVSDVHWSGWGAAKANGTGTASYIAPDQPAAEGKQEKATVVAFDLGQCGGKLAYRKLTWYFPQHGEKLNEAAALDTCEA